MRTQKNEESVYRIILMGEIEKSVYKITLIKTNGDIAVKLGDMFARKYNESS